MSKHPRLQAAFDDDSPLRFAITERVARWSASGEPGGVFGIVTSEGLVHAQGFGLADIEGALPNDSRTSFHVASLSKEITAGIVLRLADEGVLSLQDDVRRHVPELPDYGAIITLQDLLSHTSGLRDQWQLLELAGMSEGAPITQGMALDVVMKQRSLNFAPGTSAQYTNTGYTLLAVAVERALQESFENVAERLVFAPLGMANTYFAVDGLRVEKTRASAYKKVDGAFVLDLPNFSLAGPTNLQTTLEDFAKWDAHLSAGFANGLASIIRMQKPITLKSGLEIPYASGLVRGNYRGLPTTGHPGKDAAFRARHMRFSDQGVSFICFCNRSDRRPAVLIREIADIVFESELRDSPRASYSFPETPRSDALARASALVGHYRDSSSEEIVHVTADGGSLRVLIADESYVLRETRANTYRLDGEEAEWTFREKDGVRFFEARSVEPTEAPPTIFELLEPISLDTFSAHRLSWKGFRAEFACDEIGTCVVLYEDDDTVWCTAHGMSIPLAAFAEDRFVLPNLLGVKVLRTPEGDVRGLELSSSRVRHLPFLRVDF